MLRRIASTWSAFKRPTIDKNDIEDEKLPTKISYFYSKFNIYIIWLTILVIAIVVLISTFVVQYSHVMLFWEISGIAPGKGQCLYKRAIFDNYASPEECKTLITLAERNLISENEGDGLFGAGLKSILGDTHSDTPTQLKILNKTRTRLNHLVSTYFGHKIYPEYTQITCRKPGKSGKSHDIHVDSCGVQLDGTCLEDEQYCCSWRSHTLIMYLNDEGVDFEGGEFIFAKELELFDAGCGPEFIVKPKCGRVVFFTSGPENPHGVEKVVVGMRWAFAMWFTMKKKFDEGLFLLE